MRGKYKRKKERQKKRNRLLYLNSHPDEWFKSVCGITLLPHQRYLLVEMFKNGSRNV